jgi:hypothetical protein
MQPPGTAAAGRWRLLAVRLASGSDQARRRAGAALACLGGMRIDRSARPAASGPAAPTERPPIQPDTVPTGVPPERPFSPPPPDVQPGSPGEVPMPGVPPEVAPAIAPVEVPPLGPGG